MATTMKLIGKVILGADAANIEFTDIPGTMTDLLLVCSLRSARASALSDEIKLRFNGASSDTSHTSRLLQGSGASAASSTSNTCYVGEATAATATSSTFTSIEIYIPNYAGSTNKSFSATSAHETNGSTAYIGAHAGLWSSTSAITSIKILTNTASNLKADSSAYLYGLGKS